MVGAAEGPALQQRMAGVRKPRHGPDLRGLQGLPLRHVRQDGGQALGQHALPRPGAADEEDVVPPGGGDLQGPLHVLLAHDVGKVRSRLPRGGGDEGRGGREKRLPAQVAQQGREVRHGIDREAPGQGGLRRVLRRDIQLPDAQPRRGHGHGQHPLHRPQGPGKAQLPQEGGPLPRGLDVPLGGQEPQEDGQVVDRALFFQRRRGQVHRDAADRELEPRGLHRRAHPLPGLLHRRVGQAHNIKGGQTAGQVALGPYFIPGHAGQAQRAHLTEHKNRRPFSIQHQYTTEKGRLPRKTSLGDAQLWVR